MRERLMGVSQEHATKLEASSHLFSLFTYRAYLLERRHRHRT